MRLFSLPLSLSNVAVSRNTKFMAQSVGSNTGKKLIRIDVSSDPVCPYCFVGKKNLDKAMGLSKDQYDFEIRWHPFFLNPDAPKDGMIKKDFYMRKYGPSSEQMEARTAQVFRGLGYDYDTSGLIGPTLDGHRLLTFAGHQGYDKQHALMEELCLGYFTKGRFIADPEFLAEAARKAGVEGAAEFLEDTNNGVKEVYEQLEKYSSNISAVPHFVINDKLKLSGAQPPEAFLRYFQAATN
ncbi:uncharacterized protein YwbO-like [Telopea speciosissima]|uniref:uncharacterized protein YwbO-like n=1 Tax=Telopea speciosissima TaxID=54955 RepID=UPI001CC44D79|nr:uncharacterized protein YwbO-like [Telopea speciosissima]